MTARTVSRRSRAALAGAIVVCLATALGACAEGEPAAEGRADSATDSATDSAAVELTVPEAGGAKCAMPTADVLAQMDTAFEGTVTEVEGDQVTLEVERWFTGGEADTVVVTQPSTAISEAVVVFEPDRTYLVSASGDVVSMCGYSAEANPGLAEMYDEAFPAE